MDINADAVAETVAIINNEGGDAQPFTGDATKETDIERMVASACDAYGRIDVLDNNVGVAILGGVCDLTEETWDRVFAVNLKSCFLSMKHVVPSDAAPGWRLNHKHLVHCLHPLHGRAICDLFNDQGCHEPPNANSIYL